MPNTKVTGPHKTPTSRKLRTHACGFICMLGSARVQPTYLGPRTSIFVHYCFSCVVLVTGIDQVCVALKSIYAAAYLLRRLWRLLQYGELSAAARLGRSPLFRLSSPSLPPAFGSCCQPRTLLSAQKKEDARRAARRRAAHAELRVLWLGWVEGAVVPTSWCVDGRALRRASKSAFYFEKQTPILWRAPATSNLRKGLLQNLPCRTSPVTSHTE